MPRFLAIVFCVVVGMTGAWAAICRYMVAHSISSIWVDGIYARKEAAAQRTQSPKLVIVGGSGIHYGFSAEHLSKLTGYPAVNLGTHAALGLDYILHRARSSLARGDTAILAIEWPLYRFEARTWVLAEQVMQYDIGYLRHEKPRYVARLLFGISPFDVIRTQAHRMTPWGSPIGRAESVSPWGDETLVVSKLLQPGSHERLLRESPSGVFVTEPPPKALIDFFEWARVNGVHVALAWAPVLDRVDYHSPAYSAFFEGIRSWYRRTGFEALGEPTAYFRPIGEMFDTDTHPNETGRINATEVMAREFCKIRRCTPTPTATKTDR